MHTPDPAALDTFWKRTLERARATPLDAQVEQVRDPKPYFTFRVTYKSLDGVPVRAYLGVPADKDGPGKWPVIVTGPGYGGTEFGQTLSECQRGYLVLQVFPRGQGESGELWKVKEGADQAWVNHGAEDPEGFYYQGAFADLVRGLDYVLTRPDADGSRCASVGTSQGGMLALGHAAIDERIRAAVAHVPALCDLLKHGGFLPDFSPGKGFTPEAFARTWSYFDPVNLARRIQAATLLSAGGRDKVCPAESIQAVFANLPRVKGLIQYPDLIHTSSAPFYRQTWAWLDQYL